MRVIAGSARGRRLKPVPGDGTRPITDRAKEALFSILAREVPGAWVLDLFAGTGGVGIEALSRGAEGCDFVDLAPEALQTIQANLVATGLASDDVRVLRRDAFQFLSRPPEMPYHLIYVAPPQYKGLWLRALLALDAEPGWLAEDGVIVVQIHPREEQAVALAHFEERDRRDYGSVRLIFYGPRLDPIAPEGDPALRADADDRAGVPAPAAGAERQ